MNPYISEIRMFGGNFAPVGWALCDGAMLNISEYGALYSLLGTTYGGDGQTTFGLPDLRGRIPVSMGKRLTTTYTLGQPGGSESVSLTTPELPTHTHTAFAVGVKGNQEGPKGAVWADSDLNAFATTTPNASMAASAITAVGGSQPHDNLMPSVVINFIICMEGIYPSQS